MNMTQSDRSVTIRPQRKLGAAVPIQQNWHNFLNRYILKDSSYRLAFQELCLKLAEQSELEQVVTISLSELTRLLHLEFATLILRRDAGAEPQILATKIIRQSQSSIYNVQPLLELALGLDLPHKDRVHLVHTASHWPKLSAIKIAINQEVVCILTISSYRRSDILSPPRAALLESLASLLKFKLQNALLIEELKHKVLDHQVVLEEYRRSRDALQMVNQQIIEAIERERVRLSRDLHDEPLQRLMLVLRQFDARDSGITPREQYCWKVTQEVSTTLRNICSNLRPPVLDNIDLAIALESLVRRVERENPLTVALTIAPELKNRRMGLEVELALYRTAQEGLQNVVKHANASCVSIELYQKERVVYLRINDNGCGFTIPAQSENWLDSNHFGLIGLMERLRGIGGVLEIISEPGKGTILQAQVEVESGN